MNLLENTKFETLLCHKAVIFVERYKIHSMCDMYYISLIIMLIITFREIEGK